MLGSRGRKREAHPAKDMTEKEMLDALWKAYRYVLYYKSQEERKETEGGKKKPPEGG